MGALEAETLAFEDFLYFQREIQRLAGVYWSPQKLGLLESRLQRRVQALGAGGFSGYREHLESGRASAEEWRALIHLATTHKTNFFREPAHFDYLRQHYVPEWVRKNPGRELAVWSAACSSGEEVYSLIWSLAESEASRSGFQVEGSDIDDQVLWEAANGVYSVSRLEGIPTSFRSRAVSLGRGALRDWARVRDEWRPQARFVARNLVVDGELPPPSSMDVIFCRNVFIYFQPELIQRIVAALYRVARPGALLAIGHSESLLSIPHDWSPVGPALFVKPASRSALEPRFP